MEAGDALFFHSNLLHRSDKNDSDRRRWAFLIAYNRASNDPVIPHHHPQCTKLEKVQNYYNNYVMCNKPILILNIITKDFLINSKDINFLKKLLQHVSFLKSYTIDKIIISFCFFRSLIQPFWSVPPRLISPGRTS